MSNAAATAKVTLDLQDLYENAPCGYHSIGPDGTILRINQTELTWLGYTSQELVGKRRLGELVSSRFYSEYEHAIQALIVEREISEIETELVAGRLVTLDVPPGQVGAAEFDFRDTVVLGGRGRQFGVDVAGGMGGVVIDLRDVPLRLPDRPDRRRELLAAWQQPLWQPLEP